MGQRLVTLRATGLDMVIRLARQKAEALGLSLEDLTSAPSPRPGRTRKARSDAGKPVAARYRGPKGEEWSGRGRPPGWLAEAEKAGKRREDFRI